MTRSLHRCVWTGVIGCLAAVAGACTESGSDATDTHPVQRAVYAIVIHDLVEQSGVALDDANGPPLVFVESIAVDGMPLEVQVALIGEVAETYDLRFIDDREEAVDWSIEGEPVRAGTILIGLGPMVGTDPIEVRGEYYRGAADIAAFRYEVGSTAGSWALTTGPTGIEPEGLVASP